MPEAKDRRFVRVRGTVQGVGFRPFVYALAERYDLSGCVGNDDDGVFIEVEGWPAALEEFVTALSREAPALARVDSVDVAPRPAIGSRGFAITESRHAGDPGTDVTADAATCADCLRELRDPDDRRFGYPFINCTNCGPRYTIVRGVPYDRPRTTMAGFRMCARCQAEYDDPRDRRFHAQPVCCADCGPRLRLVDRTGGTLPGDPIAQAAELLRDSGIVAVKGLGGYHLAASAGDAAAVSRLRAGKHRERRPFAVMVAGVEAARRLCELTAEESLLLAGPVAPIVLLPRRTRGPGSQAVAEPVAPGRRELGLMLPSTPLHHLLAAACGAPLVMTSGNLSDEPIVTDDADAFARLGGLADAFLTHDRPIETRVDDSVLRVVGDRVVPIRRSRGYAPQPLAVPWPFPRPVLACGPELKNTFCYGRGSHAIVSAHIGDLANYETFDAYTAGIDHLGRLLGITPEVIAYDLHPEYLSTKYAQDRGDAGDGVELVGVQHHHAHIASCLADNGEPGPVIGVAFDGLGMGADGTLWGGEFLIADLVRFDRAAHLEPIPMPGGAAAIRQPWRMAVAHLDAAYAGAIPAGLEVLARHPRWGDVLAAARAGANSPLTSSMGRLFDAVSAVLGVCDEVSYEGQAAIELEQRAAPAEVGSYGWTISPGSPARISGSLVLRAVLEDAANGRAIGAVAARFHSSVARLVTEMCVRLRSSTGLRTVALSGGVFQNALLLRLCTRGLVEAGFGVLTHRRVPANDGGISLGQAAVAGARDRLR